MTGLQPLPFQQLTRLQLRNRGSRYSYKLRDILTKASGLRQLEVLEVLEARQALDLGAFDATALSRLPKLRLLNLTGSLLWSLHTTTATRRVQMDQLQTVQHLMNLQRRFPNIEWVLGQPR